MQDRAHASFFGRADRPVEQQQDVDVRLQTELPPSVSAKGDDEAGAAGARGFVEQPLQKVIDAIRETLKGGAPTVSTGRGRGQRVAGAFNAGERRRHSVNQATGAGSDEWPIRYASTPRAQLRPSAIAQTINDWPRCMSPAAKTPGTFVIQSALRATVPRSVSAIPSSLIKPFRSGPTNPIASSTRSASNSIGALVSRSVAWGRATRPSAVPAKRSVAIA